MKKIRTNSKQVRSQIRKHIIENLTAEGLTIDQAVCQVESEFESWYCPNEKKRNPNRQEAFISWLWGLPGVFNQLWMTYDILKFMASIGLPLPENKTEEEGTELYMRLLYMEYMKLRDERMNLKAEEV